MIQTDLIDGLDLDGELVGYLREAPLVDVDPRAEDAPRRRRPARLAPQPVLVLGTASKGWRDSAHLDTNSKLTYVYHFLRPFQIWTF